jgi:hypothetical protein
MQMSKFTPFNLFIRQCLLYPLTSPFLPPVIKVEKDYSYANNALIGTLEAGVAGGLPRTGQTIEFVDGDDGHYQKGFPLTGAKYTDNGDGTITDRGTNLMWVKDGAGAGCNGGVGLTWAAAIAFCEALDFAGHADWRLPNIKELFSIADIGRDTPAIDPLFINTRSDYYWSSSTLVYATGNAWILFGDWGGVSVTAKTPGTFYLRPVRG